MSYILSLGFILVTVVGCSTAFAGMRVEAGYSYDEVRSSYSYNVDGFSGTGAANAYRSSVVFAVGYLLPFDGSTWSAETNLNLSTPSIDAIKNNPIRFEMNALASVFEVARIKFGPCLLYFHGNDPGYRRTAYGGQVMGEIDVQENLFASAGYSLSYFSGSYDGIDVRTTENSFQIRLGRSF